MPLDPCDLLADETRRAFRPLPPVSLTLPVVEQPKISTRCINEYRRLITGYRHCLDNIAADYTATGPYKPKREVTH